MAQDCLACQYLTGLPCAPLRNAHTFETGSLVQNVICKAENWVDLALWSFLGLMVVQPYGIEYLALWFLFIQPSGFGLLTLSR